MSRGINKAILIGNLGSDPEVRTLPSGDAVANVSLATSESWTDKSTGELKERTEWHRVVFFGKLAEIVQQYLHTGSRIYVEGRLRTRQWQTSEGHERYHDRGGGRRSRFDADARWASRRGEPPSQPGADTAAARAGTHGGRDDFPF